MLVLSRKLGERIVINDEVTVEIVAIRKDKVRVGVTAPRDVPVLRGELRKKAAETAIKVA